MNHSFLIETGQWLVNGHWLERNQVFTGSFISTTIEATLERQS